MSFRVYDWKDRVHSSVNRISLAFKVFDHGAHCNGTAFLSLVVGPLNHYSETYLFDEVERDALCIFTSSCFYLPTNLYNDKSTVEILRVSNSPSRIMPRLAIVRAQWNSFHIEYSIIVTGYFSRYSDVISKTEIKWFLT